MGHPRPAPDTGTAARVAPIEIFFDVVFVLTITQLTHTLETDLSWATLGRTVLIFGLLWYLYTGYAWLTNHVPPRRSTDKLLLLAGMAGFLLTAVALPAALADTGLVFAIGYLIVVLVHLLLFTHSDARAGVRRLAPYNLGAALLVLASTAFSGPAVPALWTAAVLTQAVLPYLLPRHSWISVAAAFHLRPAHFVERHGLLVIVALGESVITIGMGVPTDHFTAGRAGTILLALALPAALWWIYFADTRPAEAVLADAAPAARSRIAARTFVLPHFLLLLGVIPAAADLHATVAHPDQPATPGAALALSGGVTLFLIGIAATRRALGLPIPRSRPTAALVVLATIPVGVTLPATVQLATVTAVLVLMLLSDARRRVGRPRTPVGP
ncbi:low temperature requirement protein A [Micromonospora sp. RHAY321]|uniref:low temperature requirement protein A n=1 Tax=Micromonospora sp. RHAY321 TaxID=2944807 RepID=UPI00207C9F63|nr:low temperature requirement protein A [Micromonospora sp. RHAY321]MCO1593647.1 low temperature requirement protein A [Micromonospora sp. RHAY321]